VDIAPEFRAELDSSEYFYLREISEPRDNSLRLVIEEAAAGLEEPPRKVAGVVFSGLHRIEGTGRLFELSWDIYVAYSVQNESYSKLDETDKVESGRLVRIYSRSRFLDHISMTTIATPEYPGPLLHVEVICLNHVIDVAATEPPKIRLVGARSKPNPN